MKLVGDDYKFIIPIDKDYPTIIHTNEYKSIIIDYLSSYFISKKKSKCIIYDDENEIMNYNDVNFIYISDDLAVDNNLLLKSKSITNTEITKLILENDGMFQSIENIRQNLHDLLTDSGFIKIKKILSNGLDHMVDLEINEFDISSILSMISIEDNEYSNEIKLLIILNLLVYVNREKTNLIYIDFETSEIFENWLKRMDANNYFLIDNERSVRLSNRYNLLLIQNTESSSISELQTEQIHLLSFMNHKLIYDNLHYFDEKNIQLFNYYRDINTTFFIKCCD